MVFDPKKPSRYGEVTWACGTSGNWRSPALCGKEWRVTVLGVKLSDQAINLILRVFGSGKAKWVFEIGRAHV